MSQYDAVNSMNGHDNPTQRLDQRVVSKGSSQYQDTFFDRVKKTIVSFATVSELLRLMGAIAVLISMSMFLLQGWAETGDFQRFCMMVAQTVLLGFAGFSMFKWLRENKSARLFFGLSLVSVTANFTTLAALIYSVFSLDGQTSDYPNFAHWVVTDIGTLFASLGIAGIVLVPLSLLAFSILARPAAKAMTAWYIGLNLLLLLPVREVGIIAILVLVATICMMKSKLMTSAFNNGSTDVAHATFSWGTREGKFARLVMFLPLIIMMVRSLMHYEITTFSTIAIFSAVYWFSVQSSNIVGKRFETLFTLIAASSAVIVAYAFTLHLESWFYISIPLLPVFALIITAACADLVMRVTNEILRKLLIKTTATAIVICFGLNHIIYHNLGSFALGFLAGLAMLSVAYRLKSQWLGISSVLLLIGLPVFYAENIFALVVDSGWLGFAITGVSVIILASVIDRYGAIIKLKFSNDKAKNHQVMKVDEAEVSKIVL